MKQIWINRAGGNINTIGTGILGCQHFSSIANSITDISLEDQVKQVMPTAGTISNLRCNLDAVITSGTLDVIVRKNKVDTLLKIQFANGTGKVLEDTTNSISVVAGDFVSLKIKASSISPQPRILDGFSMLFDSSTAKQSVLLSSSQTNLQGTASTQYNSLGSRGSWQASYLHRQIPFPVAGKIKAIYNHFDTTVDTGQTFKIGITRSGATIISGTQVTFTDADTDKNLTGLNIAIAEGDLLTIQSIRSAVGSNTPFLAQSILFEADVDGYSALFGNTDDPLSTTNGAIEYNHILAGDDPWGATRRTVYSQGAFTLDRFRVALSTSRTGTTYTFRTDINGANGNSIVTIAGPAKTGVDTVNSESIVQDDTLGAIAKTVGFKGGPPGNNSGWGARMFITPAVTATRRIFIS